MYTKPISRLCAIATILLACACDNHSHKPFTEAQRHAADSVVKSMGDLQRLDSLYTAMHKRGDMLGQMAALREKGKMLRNESQFAAALRTHGEGLRLAEQAGDTIEWVQALNNIGTDYRRMGILDMAQRYHYGAWMMAKDCSDTSFVAKKNRVVSLNGLANVYLTTHNLVRADSVLRMALAGEAELGSLTGQAINYANLGSIFEERGQQDSAWAYYRKSLELNQRDSNLLGVALCHNYFGDMYKKARDYDHALQEYERSYNIMKDSKDNWHALNSLIDLAGVYELKGNDAKAKAYLDEALHVAKSIKSNEHLAEIYNQYYRLYKQRGDYRSALSYHELAGALEDSLVDMDKVNRMQNTSLDLERNRQDQRMAEANNRLSHEQTTRRVGYIVFFVILLLMGGFIGMLIHARHVRARSHKALKKLNDMRETFFTNITHEFRTPLTVILGLSHDLQQPATAAEVNGMGKTIERQGQRMLRLINQLLDISKIKSEIGIPDWRHGDLVAYIAMIVETYTIYANRRDIKLQFIAREKSINTDFVPDYVGKVVSNLLSNALKFTDKYGTVNVSLWQKDHHVMLDVADTGRGIPSEALPHIFEEFYQADQSGDGIGTGVGLALVYQIVKSLGGTISVDSTVGKGTTFHISLPMHKSQSPLPSVSTSKNDAVRPASPLLAEEDPDIAQAEPQAEPSEKKAEGETADDKPNILIIEDNADIAAFIGKQLSGRCSVTYATNGQDGLDKAHEALPDLIITDLMMPVMDGLELCRRIRNDELTCHIPIIVVTAKVSEAERIEGLKAGADAYLAKPFSADELNTRVEKLLEQRRMLRKKFAQSLDQDSASTEASTSGSTLSDLDRRFLTKLTDCVYLMLGSHKSVDVEAVASKLCMSYGQLNRKLTALTGYTPAQYIQRVKIKKAQRMLIAHPELGFNDVAEQCGFSDYSWVFNLNVFMHKVSYSNIFLSLKNLNY